MIPDKPSFTDNSNLSVSEFTVDSLREAIKRLSEQTAIFPTEFVWVTDCCCRPYMSQGGPAAQCPYLCKDARS